MAFLRYKELLNLPCLPYRLPAEEMVKKRAFILATLL
jgi:hypothetical protein